MKDNYEGLSWVLKLHKIVYALDQQLIQEASSLTLNMEPCCHPSKFKWWSRSNSFRWTSTGMSIQSNTEEMYWQTWLGQKETMVSSSVVSNLKLYLYWSESIEKLSLGVFFYIGHAQFNSTQLPYVNSIQAYKHLA